MFRINRFANDRFLIVYSILCAAWVFLLFSDYSVPRTGLYVFAPIALILFVLAYASAFKSKNTPVFLLTSVVQSVVIVLGAISASDVRATFWGLFLGFILLIVWLFPLLTKARPLFITILGVIPVILAGAFLFLVSFFAIIGSAFSAQ